MKRYHSIVKAKPREFFLISLLLVWIFLSILSNSYYSMQFGYQGILVFRFLCLICFVAVDIYFPPKIQKKIIIPLVMFFLICALAAYGSGTLRKVQSVFTMAVIFISFMGVDFDKVCKAVFWGELFDFLFVLLSAKIGIITDYIQIYEGRRRDCLGATFPGYMPIIYINIVFCGLYSFFKTKDDLKKNWYLLIAFGLGAYYIFKVNNTRQNMVMTFAGIILFILLVIFSGFNINNKFMKIFGVIITPLCCFLIFYASYKFSWSDPKTYAINQILSGRLQFNKMGLDRYGLSLFGNSFETNMGSSINEYRDYFFIDSGYVEDGVRYGILFLLMIIVLYSYLLYHAVTNNHLAMAVWLIMLAGYNMINNMTFSVVTNTSILVFWHYYSISIAEKRKERENRYYRLNRMPG